jgi:hypothetical protein
MTTLFSHRAAGVAGALVIALAWPGSLHVAAQTQSGPSQSPPAGWVFTPGISVGETWDNNVLLATQGSESVTDFLTAISPRAALGFRGRRDTFSLDYRGSFQLYQELSELNAFDQRANVSLVHRFTPAMNFFLRNSISRSPTTDDIDVPGVQFRRQGVLLNDFRSGVDARFSRRSSMTAAYTFQYINFENEDLLVDALRRGGHGHGGSVQYGYRLQPRLSVGAEYDMRRGTVDEVQQFDVMNTLGTVDWRLTERLDLSGGFGLSWLKTGIDAQWRTAPAFRVSLSGSGQRLGWNVGYRRSFLPSFGFGGTFQNQEFQANAFAPLTRRLDVSGSFAIRENDPLNSDPLVTANVGLRSVWARSSISYLATRWMRIEGFYIAAFQDSQRPGGEVNRSRIGVQVSTSTRMRVR